MDQETKKWLAFFSIALAVMVVLLLLLSGFDINNLRIH